MYSTEVKVEGKVCTVHGVKVGGKVDITGITVNNMLPQLDKVNNRKCDTNCYLPFTGSTKVKGYDITQNSSTSLPFCYVPDLQPYSYDPCIYLASHLLKYSVNNPTQCACFLFNLAPALYTLFLQL